jgi:hypothetical protein
MPGHQACPSEARDQQHALGDASEHVIQTDDILAEWPDDLDGRKRTMRVLLRTIVRLLDEASTPSIHADRAHSDERTNRELRGVLSALDIPADRRAFDVTTDVQGLVMFGDLEANDLARERLCYLRDTLNSKDLG